MVFINVIKNAIEAMEDGGEIHIKAAALQPDRIRVQVIDREPGIPAERIPILGEPFYTTKEKGTGLGLMICYKIIRAHHGHLGIQSTVGVGTTVDIELPVSVGTFEQDGQ